MSGRTGGSRVGCTAPRCVARPPPLHALDYSNEPERIPPTLHRRCLNRVSARAPLALWSRGGAGRSRLLGVPPSGRRKAYKAASDSLTGKLVGCGWATAHAIFQQNVAEMHDILLERPSPIISAAVKSTATYASVSHNMQRARAGPPAGAFAEYVHHLPEYPRVPAGGNLYSLPCEYPLVLHGPNGPPAAVALRCNGVRC